MNVENRLDSHVQLGCISIASLDMISPFPQLEERLEELLHERAEDLTEFEDDFRLACRDMLRIGSYKPTGRSRPASEYLLRTATNSSFPRINPVVDLINYISLKYLVPLSLWDMEKVKADSWLFRTGSNEESYVFNASGQAIALQDLATGYAVTQSKEQPIVNPVKDSLQTKTDENTRKAGIAIYYPAHWAREPSLEYILGELRVLAGLRGHVICLTSR